MPNQLKKSRNNKEIKLHGGNDEENSFKKLKVVA